MKRVIIMNNTDLTMAEIGYLIDNAVRKGIIHMDVIRHWDAIRINTDYYMSWHVNKDSVTYRVYKDGGHN